jgi:hypothetical protein
MARDASQLCKWTFGLKIESAWWVISISTVDSTIAGPSTETANQPVILDFILYLHLPSMKIPKSINCSARSPGGDNLRDLWDGTRGWGKGREYILYVRTDANTIQAVVAHHMIHQSISALMGYPFAQVRSSPLTHLRARRHLCSPNRGLNISRFGF